MSANLSSQNQRGGDNKIIKQSVSKENDLTSWDQKHTPPLLLFCRADLGVGAAACPTPGPQPAGSHRSLPAGDLGSGLHLCSWGPEGSPLLNDRACMGYPWLHYSSKAEVSKGGHLKTMSQTEGLLKERWWKEMKRPGESDLTSVCLLRPVCFQSSVASNAPT